MAECKSCGKTYFSKSCPHCNSDFAINRKEKYKQHKAVSKAKGDAYEQYVAKHFRDQGYTVAEHGKINGVKDQSIDLILKRDNEVILVQCKNYKADTTYKINHEKIKAFVGETAFYLQDNPIYEGYELKRLYVVSNPVLDKSAINFINNHTDKINYLHLVFHKPINLGTPVQKSTSVNRAIKYQDNIKKKIMSEVVLSKNNKNKEAYVSITCMRDDKLTQITNIENSDKILEFEEDLDTKLYYNCQKEFN